MKKIIALVLAVVTVAALAMTAAAAVPNHTVNQAFVTHGADVTDNWNACEEFWSVDGLGDLWIIDGRIKATLANWAVIKCSENVKASFPKEQAVSQKWVTCDEAIGDKELKTVCEENGIAHATVFRQRNVDKAGDLTALNWQTAKKNTTIILFRAEGEEAWTLLAQSELGEKTAEATLPGAGSYVVAMTW